MKNDSELRISIDDGKKKEEIDFPKQFIGADPLKSYLFFRNYLTRDRILAFTAKQYCVEFGKELLPTFIDPDEKDEEQIKKNKAKQDTIDALFTRACTALKTKSPNKRQVKYKYLDKGNRVYELKAEDADNCEAVKDELKDVMDDFNNQQYEQHRKGLAEVDSEIFHVLIQENIIQKTKPTIKDILDKKIKKVYEKLED